MLHKTRAIVLRTTKYSETSVVVRAYTELFGMQSYLVPGVRMRRPRFAPHLFEPLTPLDMVVYHKDTGALQRIGDARPSHLLTSIHTDVHKGALAMFIAEVTDRVIQEVEPNEGLFEHLLHVARVLDALPNGFNNLHLFHLLHLATHLGIAPVNNYDQHSHYLDMKEGVFTPLMPNHGNFLDEPYSGYASALLALEVENCGELPLQRRERNYLLERMLVYYQLHVPGFRMPASQAVLEQVFG